MTCFFHIKNPQKNTQWIKDAVEKKGVNFTEYSASLGLSSDDVKNDKKLVGIAWGDPEIEGRILCEQLKISLHIMHSTSDDSDEFAHKLVDAQGCRMIDPASIDYTDPSIVHLTTHAGYYCAVLAEDLVSQNQRKCGATL